VLGVEKGIERSAKILMPILFILLIVMAICSMLLPNASKGLEFLFKPDFSKIDHSTFLSAMGQTFYSLSLGMGCLSTYASYFSKDTKLVKTAFSVGLIDTIVAILAGIIIFPAAFSVGIQPDAGPSLIFITLPNVFQQAFGNIPILAYIFSVMFYVLLALAALTSTISMHEVTTSFLHEQLGLSRSRAASVITVCCFIIGIFASLSFGLLREYTIAGKGFFDFLDYLTAKIMLPFGGLLISLYVGWHLDKQISFEEVTNGGKIGAGFFKVYLFILRYVAPLGILFVFANGLGLI
jgi:NSS family neurotransmitter:Na+ symporter